MRFVVCDADHMLRPLAESIVTNQGHDIVGIAESTMLATELVESSRPDVVLLDLSLGYNTDFDVVAAANRVGSTVILFSANADAALLDRYQPRPLHVPKPDFVALEELIARLTSDGRPSATVTAPEERRRRPGKAAVGPVPTGVRDAQAFYEAINGASEGDTLASIEFVSGDLPADAVDAIATDVLHLIRDTDRLLASPGAIRVYLGGAAEPGAESFDRRVHAAVALPRGTEVRAVVVEVAESPTDAFDRLRRSTPSTATADEG